MEGGVRIDLRTNIFNLIRNDEANVEDLKKLYGIAPEKFKYKEPGTGKLPIQVAREEERLDWVEFMESKGLKNSNVAVEFVKATTVKKEKPLDNKQILVKLKELIEKDDMNEINNFLEKNSIQGFNKSQKFDLCGYLVKNNKKNIFDLILEKKYLDLDTVVFNTTISNLDFFNILLKHNLDVNTFYKYIEPHNVFHDTIIFDLKEQFDICIEKGADINLPDIKETQNTPLLIANFVTSNREFFMNRLLDLNVNVNIRNAYNKDIMYYLLNLNYFSNNIDLIKKVIEKNYNLNIIFIEPDALGSKRTPILKVILLYSLVDDKNKVKDIFDLFLEKSSNETLNIKYENQNTLLHKCAFNNFVYGLEKLLDKGFDINAKSSKNNTPIMTAAYSGSYDCVKFLGDKDANLNIRNNANYTALTLAELGKTEVYDVNKKAIYDDIIQYLKNKEEGKVEEEEDKSLWKGTTKTDVDKFDTFFESPNDWSVCPICLSYVARQDGCMYMSHDCKDDNKYYHKELYQKYIYDYYGKKKVEWCTICGRSTKNHKHYELVSSKARLPDFEKEDPSIQAQLALGLNRVFFDDKNCKGFGGGGLEEKVARIRRLREYALELNDDIDKKTHAQAIKELIEETWNAPLARSKKYAKILEKKEWNIPLSNFPSPKKNETVKNEENNSKNYPNIPFNYKLPEKKEAGVCPCIVGGEDDVVTYSFDHKDREGGIDHSKECICAEDLTEAIKTINKAFKNVERPFGFCWFYKCKAKLYPNEIKNIVPDDVYEEYRKKFNKKMAKEQKGGKKHKTRKMNKKGGDGQKHILHKIDLDKVICYQPPLKLKRKN